FLLKWLEEPNPRDLVAAALFTACAALTKTEGVALAAINGVVLLLFSFARRKRGENQPAEGQGSRWAVVWFGLGVIALLMPWVLFGANLVIYALALTTKSWVQNIGSVDALERLLVHTTPVVVCLIGWHWARYENPA